jgi:signal transduction histidine kinase
LLQRHRRRFAALCAIAIALNALIVGIAVASIYAIDIGRAYVTGEAQYSKAQKSALIRLQQFVYTGDKERYAEFRELLRVPTGDRMAREALSATPADFAAARRGFLDGNIPADDVAGLSTAFYWFKSWGPFAGAVRDWKDADDFVRELSALGDTSYRTIVVQHDRTGAARLTGRIVYVDHNLTRLESAFSAKVHDIERQLRAIAIRSLIGLSLLFLCVAMFAMWRISEDAMLSERLLQRSNQELGKAKLQAEKADQSKSAFLASMSHELRTPLNAVIGYSEMMVAEVLGPLGNARYRQYASDIQGAGAHLLELINDVLDISRIEAGKMELHREHIDLGRLFESIAALTGERARNAGVDLVVHKPRTPVTLLADELRLRQVLLNLATNAIKFTNAGGTVEVGVEPHDDGSLALFVRDDGIGMSDDQIALAMEPFSQVDHQLNRKHQGTGLGLPITKKLVEMHGGALRLESELGIGTLAWVDLPKSSIVAAAPNSRTAIERPSAGDEVVALLPIKVSA